uniref:Uncharacterized protein n=1 Tax=Hyaloperonospora arabidopsidis (strain Emoy2) TaxID=559515 RepID=M4BM20_HYAAE
MGLGQQKENKKEPYGSHSPLSPTTQRSNASWGQQHVYCVTSYCCFRRAKG